MRKRPLLEMQGELCIWTQEGGYVDSSVLVGRGSVADVLLTVLQLRNSSYREGETGLTVRLTVEVIERNE